MTRWSITGNRQMRIGKGVAEAAERYVRRRTKSSTGISVDLLANDDGVWRHRMSEPAQQWNSLRCCYESAVQSRSTSRVQQIESVKRNETLRRQEALQLAKREPVYRRIRCVVCESGPVRCGAAFEVTFETLWIQTVSG